MNGSRSLGLGLWTTIFAILLVISWACSTGIAFPQQKAIPPSQGSPKLVATGRSQFLLTCAACHGTDAKGGDGPNLHQQGLSKAFITDRVTHGVKDEMPAFTKLTPDQLAAVSAYILSIQ